MASDVSIQEKTKQILYKCCPQKAGPKTVVCVNCGNGYHIVCANNSKDSFVYLKGLLISCCKENDNISLKDDDILCELEKYKKKCSELTEMNEEYERLNIEMTEQKNSLEAKINDMKMQYELLVQNNELYKELNKELQEKNKLQQIIIDERKTKTYADAVVEPKEENIKTPKLIIDTKNEAETSQIFEEIKNEIYTKTSIPIEWMKAVNTNKIMLQCKKFEDIHLVENILKKQASDKFKISIQKLKNPLVKITGIDMEIHSRENILHDIVNRNNIDEQDVNIKHVYINKKNSKQTAIIELSKSAYAKIMKDEKMYIGYHRCKVWNEYNLNKCFNCSQYGHSSKNCQYESKCAKCAGNHKTYECKSKTIKCAVCCMRNSKYKENNATDHMATEINKCPSYKKLLKRVISDTDYPSDKIPKTDLEDSSGKKDKKNKIIQTDQN